MLFKPISCYLPPQKELADFEQNLKNFSKASYCVGVANATDGLELAWLAQDLRQGDEIICCSHTMIATASAIKTAGAEPIPVELGYDNLIDPDAIEAAITDRTVGIMPTHLNGRICNMDRIMNIAKKYNLIVIEDAAQSLGAKYKGKHAGTFGNGGAFSFYPAKVLGSLGDGGAFITNDQNTFEGVYELHDHGRSIDGEVKRWGRNSRLDNLQAAILDFKLKKYDDVVARRREIASIYHSRLSSFKQLLLPPAPSEDSDNFDVYQNYEIQAEKRDALKEFLYKNGIGTLVQWDGKGIHQWKYLGFKSILPKIENFFNNCIMLPMNTFITNDDVEYVTEKISEFYKS